MPSFFRFRLKSTAPRDPPFDYQTIDYEVIRREFARIEAWMQDFRVSNHEPYVDLVIDAASHVFSKRPPHLQAIHDNDNFMCDILSVLRQAADPVKNTTASKLMLMVWQARYLYEKYRSARIQGKVDPSTNTVPRLAVDEDYNERIETLMPSLKAELILVLTDLDDILPHVPSNMLADDASGLDVAPVGAGSLRREDGYEVGW